MIILAMSYVTVTYISNLLIRYFIFMLFLKKKKFSSFIETDMQQLRI